MFELLVLRHGKSAWPPGVPDRERPLAERGQRETERIGRYLREQALIPSLILSSPALRARSTADICAAAAGLDPDQIEVHELLYSGSVRDILALIGKFEDQDRIMIVGHNPTFDMLLEALCPHAFEDFRRDKILSTANLGVVQIDDGQAELLDIVKPKRLPD